LVAIALAIQENPQATVRARSDAVRALLGLSQGAGRSEALHALLRVAKNSPSTEVRDQAVFVLSLFSPYRREEAPCIEKLLEAKIGDTFRHRLEDALARPKDP
jgi:hypothetical protein